MINQRTLAKDVKVTGIGLHSGRKVTMKLIPAEADFGIQFIRTDIANSQPMTANALTVGTTENATTLGSGSGAIHTVEHLLGTLYGLGINNCLIEIDGPEVPIMDGSGASFVFLLKETGIKNLNKSKKFLVILDTVRVEKDGKWAQFEPHQNLVIDSTIVFAHPVIKTQRFSFEFSCETFI
ncbi:MAG: UDP-3-O-acyl-N-acetylglucosamine deacetylase, partial [Bacteriovoracaceae bacterium]